MYEFIRVEQPEEHIAVVTLDRPDRLNALNGPMILELNARPGLAVQVANRAGLLPRLRAAAKAWRPGLGLDERIELGCTIARDAGRRAA